jgi:hypothetical protein
MISISDSEFMSDRTDQRNNNASPANSAPSDGPTGVSVDAEALLVTSSREAFDQLQRDEQQPQQAQWFRFAIGFSLVSALLFVVIDALGDRKVEATLLEFLKWVEEYPVEGVLAVIVVYIFATILFVPGSILTLGTGFAFGSACENKAVGVMLASTVRSSLSLCTFILLGCRNVEFLNDS